MYNNDLGNDPVWLFIRDLYIVSVGLIGFAVVGQLIVSSICGGP